MSITYNPYNWKIRPRNSTLDEYKQKLQELESKRADIIDLIQFRISTDRDNLVIGRYILMLNEIQEEIDVMNLRCFMESEVYI